MKRDLELIRQILIATEAKPDFNDLLSPKKMNLPNWSEVEINYHLLLLDEAGYLKIYKEGSDNQMHCWAVRLTWNGHEFLDAARDDTRWNKALSVLGRFGSFGFDVLKSVLSDLALQSVRGALNLPPA